MKRLNRLHGESSKSEMLEDTQLDTDDDKRAWRMHMNGFRWDKTSTGYKESETSRIGAFSAFRR